MAKFFLFLTIIAAGAAAGLGWMTYTKITEVKTKLSNTEKDLTTTKGTLEKTKFTLKDTQDTLTATKTALDTANETIKTDDAKVADLTTQLGTATAQVTTLSGSLTDLQSKYDLLAHSGTGTAQNTDPYTVKMQELQKHVDELTQLNQTLTSKAAEAEKHADELSKKEIKRVATLALPGVEGMVMAVNQGWNFAVVSLGDRQGAVPNAELLVKRGDTLIAKLKITTVEPATSIADIEPDSLSKGQRVLPGDKVIFTGPPAAAPALAPATAQ